MENDNPQQDNDFEEDSNVDGESDVLKIFLIILAVIFGIFVLYIVIDFLIDAVPCLIVLGGTIFVLALPKN